jgi:pimeloyl-ACP methyl ester carboxylesterase
VVQAAQDPGITHMLSRLPPDQRAALVSRMLPESGRALFEMLHWGLDINRGSEVRAAHVTCPVLLLAGGEDRIAPPGTVARIAALYGSRAVCETMPGMGHWLQGEAGWETVADHALAWLAARES